MGRAARKVNDHFTGVLGERRGLRQDQEALSSAPDPSDINDSDTGKQTYPIPPMPNSPKLPAQPHWLKFMEENISIGLQCDGCGTKGETNNSIPDENGFWENSGGWFHTGGLDFCPACIHNGVMDKAVPGSGV